MKQLRKLYFALIPTYKRVDFKMCTWTEADRVIKSDHRWRIAPEDQNVNYPYVAIEIRERITE